MFVVQGEQCNEHITVALGAILNGRVLLPGYGLIATRVVGLMMDGPIPLPATYSNPLMLLEHCNVVDLDYQLPSKQWIVCPMGSLTTQVLWIKPSGLLWKDVACAMVPKRTTTRALALTSTS